MEFISLGDIDNTDQGDDEINVRFLKLCNNVSNI